MTARFFTEKPMISALFESKYPLFDTHAHYDDAKFDEDRDAILSSLKDNGVGFAVDVGCSFDSIPKAYELSRKYENVYFSVGFHPNDAQAADDNGVESSLDLLRGYLADPKCVAVGELGLDYYWDEVDRAVQKKWFELQLELARELDKPVIIHDRDAHGDTMEILRKHKGVTGILHSFSGSPEMAAELIKMGWYISFSGVLTFKNAARLPEVAKMVPTDRMLLETDCPYLAPHPMRGKRNDSTLMAYTANKLAEIKGLTYEEVCRITLENAKRIYKISTP